ncbi:lytic polysaccharide monooxygenase [Xylariaceae sp. FL0016]|nr:lytic polysaccharide monooxygenase [Xylariaceae sp. FL0016]
MKSSMYASLAIAFAANVSGHALFQALWVDGVDMGTQCVRMPQSNSPVTNVASSDIRCNVGGSKGVAGKCAVKAGGSVTVEMHQQPGDRKCTAEALGGAHYGPVNVYLSKVDDAAKADGSSSFYKIFADAWSSKGSVGDNDNWGTNDLNTCCGKMDIPIPADTPAGDYLLRAEVIALHTASSAGGAQFYISCYQITVAGGTASAAAVPAGVKFPGAFKASDPGIEVNIHAKMTNYVNPGPAVVASGTTKVPGSGCGTGCASTCKVGSGAVGTAIAASPGAASSAGSSGSSGTAGSGSSSGGSAACAQAKFQQCGGQGYTGCTTCADGLSCKDVSAPYYSQCA